ncbi:MAG: YjbQ family protein [Candidatus Omnitrophica bacterium]|nr:YjbQ family protein [Candidatus Omnitrophota bacterium]
MQTFDVKSTRHTELIDITAKVRDEVDKSGVKDGVCFVFVPHTTSGITINENADPDVCKDIISELNKIIPLNDNYSHTEGNSAAHIKASLMGSSVSVFIEQGNLMLGTWQGIYFAEFDGPRSRKVWVKVIQNQK